MKIKQEDFNLKQVAESGQCFRMNPLDENKYSVIAFGLYLEIEQIDTNHFDFSCTSEEYEQVWRSYFDFDTDYGLYKTQIIESNDEFLIEAITFGYGVRILRQDLWEMLVTFLISQRKNIPAIKSCIEKISQKYGVKKQWNEVTYYSFPSYEVIAQLQLEDLKDISLGYRDKYILRLAQDIVEDRVNLKHIMAETDKEAAHKTLTGLFGVGIKVASCVELFALHYIDSFPIDVWIQRVIDQIYGGEFDVDKYHGFAGIVQQYMFYYMRSGPSQEQNNYGEKIG